MLPWKRLPPPMVATIRRNCLCSVPPSPTGLTWQPTGVPGVSRMQVLKPWKKLADGESDDGACLIRGERLIPNAVLAEVQALLPKLQLDLDPDSVDGHPTFEIQW